VILRSSGPTTVAVNISTDIDADRAQTATPAPPLYPHTMAA
jgi:hypothetical protein